MFGRLTLDSIPYHEPIIIITLAIVALVGLAVVVAVTKAGKWQYLWNEWFNFGRPQKTRLHVHRCGDADACTWLCGRGDDA